VNRNKAIEAATRNGDERRLLLTALKQRCLNCKMMDGGKCPHQLGVVEVCVKEELQRLRIARNIAPPAVAPAMTWGSGIGKGVVAVVAPPLADPPPTRRFDHIRTNEELREFLEDSENWKGLLGELAGLLPAGVASNTLELRFSNDLPPEPPKPQMSAEDAGFLERLKLKVKANYAQHKDMLRDFLNYAREHGFELRTESGMKAVSDEQHLLGFTGETLPEGMGNLVMKSPTLGPDVRPPKTGIRDDEI